MLNNVAYLGSFSNLCHDTFMFSFGKKKRIYLDYASATFVRKEVQKAMQPYFSHVYGNPSAIHKEGVHASLAVEKAREELAQTLRIRPSGIVFTGSGTESNNMALLGVIEERHKKGMAYRDMEVVSTAIEHASVLEVLAHLSSLGVVVTYVPTNEYGVITIDEFTRSLTDKTVLVVFSYVNSEIGTIQPFSKLTRIVRAYEQDHGTHIHVHIDGAQAPLWLPCALDTLNTDTLALDAGKCYGPKGVGVLAFRQKVSVAPILFGGSQENGLRPGTENTPLIIGAVKAIVLAQKEYVEKSERVTKLRDEFIAQLESIDGVVLNGHRTERVANNVNISIPFIDAEFAVISLDEKGIACATKSACGGARGDGSSVVRTITGDPKRALSTLRFSLGEDTKAHELLTVVTVLKAHIAQMKHSMQKLTPQ